MSYLKDIVLKLESGKREKGGSKSSGTPSLGGEHLNSNGGFKLQNLKYVSSSFYESMNKGVIESEDILIVKDGATTGKVSFVDRDFPLNEACINEHLFKLKIDKNLAVPKYVFFLLYSDAGQKQIMKDFRGSTIGGISRNFIEKVNLNLPSLEEQKQITAILNTADSYRQKTQELLENYDQLADSIFMDMFGDPVVNPMNWDKKSLFELVNPQRPITYGILMPKQDVKPEGVPYIKVVDMKNGKILDNQVHHTSKEIESKYKRSRLKEKDVLFSIRGHVGRVCIVPKKYEGGNITQDTARLDVNGNLTPEFMEYCLNSIGFQNHIRRYVKGAGVKGINLGDLKKLLLPLPPMEIQNLFSKQINNIKIQKEIVGTKLDLSRELFNSVLQKAFKGALNN